MFLSKSIFTFLVALSAVFFVGCGAKGAKFAGFETPKDGNAMIYVYRPSSIIGQAISYTASADTGDNNITIGNVSNGSYNKAQVPANKEVEVWAKTEAKSSVTIDTENNATYCIRAGLGMGWLVGRPKLEKVDMETCEKEIVKTQLDE